MRCFLVTVLVTLLFALFGSCETIMIEDGYAMRPDGTRGAWVGLYSSGLQRVVDSFPPVNKSTEATTSDFNSTVLRYLNVAGSYYSDIPLRLPSLFVLRLHGNLTVATNASIPAEDKYPALVELNGVSYSAVVGGTYDATGNSSLQALHLEDGTSCAVRDVVALGSANVAIVHIRGGTRHELATSEVNGGGIAGRCVWTIATSEALVHDNHVHQCVGHALDFDAYTKSSNLCENNGEQGIFVEETASNNFIFNNTCRDNKGSGIAVYSNAVGPVANNLFINNVVSGNGGVGISSGGYGHSPIKHAEGNLCVGALPNSLLISYVGNVALGNGGGGVQVAHGAVEGEYWTNNDNQDGWIDVPHAAANATVFDP